MLYIVSTVTLLEKIWLDPDMDEIKNRIRINSVAEPVHQLLGSGSVVTSLENVFFKVKPKIYNRVPVLLKEYLY